jgi:hypothetical protein
VPRVAQHADGFLQRLAGRAAKPVKAVEQAAGVLYYFQRFERPTTPSG